MCGVVGHVDHLLDADQLAQLLDDLLDDRFVAAGRQHEREKAGIERGVDRERVDVEAAAGEEPDDARELAEAILDEN